MSDLELCSNGNILYPLDDDLFINVSDCSINYCVGSIVIDISNNNEIKGIIL